MSLHFSPGSDSASFVELVGNATVVAGTKLTRDCAEVFFYPGAFPIQCLPATLHESTHHYCFSMPVGQALSACFFEAVRTQISDPKSDVRDDHLAEALIRYDIVTEVMRPIAEGIALYAEFDAEPGDSRASISPPLSDALSLFSKSVPAHIAQSEGNVARLSFLLFKARMNGSTVARRETLLSGSLIDDNDGYLTGYWLVKNWRLLLLDRLRCVAILDTDFYLQFISNFFYGDLTLARMLLDFDRYNIHNLSGSNHGKEDFINAFLMHFQMRLRYLLVELQKSDIDRMEATLSSTSGYDFDDVQAPCPRDPSVSFRAHNERMIGMGDKFVEIEQGGIGAAMVHVINSRSWISYASFQTSVRVNEHNRFILGEGEHEHDSTMPVLAGQVQARNVKQGRGEGVVELVRNRSGTPNDFHRMIWRGTQMIALLPDYSKLQSGQSDNKIPDDKGFPRFSSANIRKIVTTVTKSVRAEMKTLDVGNFVAEDCRQQIKGIRASVLAAHLGVSIRRSGQVPSDEELRQPLPKLCESSTAGLRAAAAVGFVNRGMIKIPSNLITEEQENAILSCDVQLAYRNGDYLFFRI
nr:hypothetical protein [Variovorax boronicumulans]